MRQILNLNPNWTFIKETTNIAVPISPTTYNPGTAEPINLPHSWNAIDGQDGGADYYRGTCYYVKELVKSEFPAADRYYLEIQGANSSADVYINGKALAHHDGGYSTWRVDLTEALGTIDKPKAILLTIAVDNSANDKVYPQMADFTFYGGLYRDVNLICVSETHFDLDYYGAPGIKVTPKVVKNTNGSNSAGDDSDTDTQRHSATSADVEVEVYLAGNSTEAAIRYTITDKDGSVVASTVTSDTKVNLTIENVHLWKGRKDPYLYTATAEILEKKSGAEVSDLQADGITADARLSNATILDNVSTRFGCRFFEIDPERGFILNGEEYPLRGVSRHQDRWGFGNALTREHHKEDIELIHEMGANTIRLAHYQHDRYFYDLCDEYGMVIWAEIPYISKHLPSGRENTVSQMKELIAQNYNHPSIIVWGLSNEITMNGAKDPDLIENHHILNNLAHKMDPTRLTTMACVSMCDMKEPYVQIPDVVSYNHYFGWYGGDTSMNGPWFDKFHATFPDKPIGVSEYGCEALNWHTSDPKQGDYTEDYQSYYHEELIKQLYTRPYLWATHVWNMFDFGADARNEGGENGQNHKGLITFDRKYKKDAFYAYKAWLCDVPFVHICGKRYTDRVEDVTKVTVYSNQPEVELFANGVSLGKKTCPEHFFYFEVPNAGETTLLAVAGDCTDESFIRKVDTFNENYILKEKGAILNWFDVTVKEGYLSLNDTIADIMKTFRGKLVIMQFAAGLMKDMKKNKKNASKGESSGKSGAMSFKLSSGMMDMLGGFTILRASSMVGMIGVTLTKEQLLKMNRKLNKIQKK